jgi:acetyl esterase
LQAFLSALAAAAGRLPAHPTLADLRRVGMEARLPWNSGGPRDAERHDILVRADGLDVPVRSYRPQGARADAALFYLHGGGWSLLNLDTHDRLLREYAAACGLVVVGIDYPLSPEVRFPRSLDVTTEVVGAVCARGIAGILEPLESYAIGGDSSGANIAVAVALQRMSRAGAAPGALILNYGVYDADLTRPSYAAFGQAPYQLTTGKLDTFWSNYCETPEDRLSPLASPVHARLEGLCPCHLVIAGQDILRDENLAFADALRAAGVQVSIDFHGDAPHAFLEAFAFSATPLRTIARTAAWLTATLGPAPT